MSSPTAVRRALDPFVRDAPARREIGSYRVHPAEHLPPPLFARVKIVPTARGEPSFKSVWDSAITDTGQFFCGLG